jgi:hypothetical protein
MNSNGVPREREQVQVPPTVQENWLPAGRGGWRSPQVELVEQGGVSTRQWLWRSVEVRVTHRHLQKESCVDNASRIGLVASDHLALS